MEEKRVGDFFCIHLTRMDKACRMDPERLGGAVSQATD